MENPPPPPPPPPRLRPLPPLPDEILMEILCRLPFKSLLRFRCASKSWHRLISTSCKNLPPAMCGLFFGYPTNRFASLQSRTYIGSALIETGLAFLLSNMPPRLCLVDCCNGLLLFMARDYMALFICNPATRKWAQIPGPPLQPYLLLLAFDSRRSKNYRVVSVPCTYDKFEVFFSETRKWTTIKRSPGSILPEISHFGFLDGILYYCDPNTADTLAIDTEGWAHWRVRRPNVPPQRKHFSCLGQSRGILHYATHLGNIMRVWVLKDSSSNEYILKHRNRFQDMVDNSNCVCPDGMAFHQDLDVMFLKQRRGVFAYSMISRKTEKICDLKGRGPVFPYSPCFLEDLELVSVDRAEHLDLGLDHQDLAGFSSDDEDGGSGEE